MIGNIPAYNDEILRERRRALGHLPIPRAIAASVVLAAKVLEDLHPTIQFIGRTRVKGFRPVGEPAFIDISGFGSRGEPALTLSQTLEHIKELTREHGTLAWGLTKVGQFQGYLQAWKVKGA